MPPPRRTRWFWPTIVAVLVVVIALVVWTLAQTSALAAPGTWAPTPLTATAVT